MEHQCDDDHDYSSDRLCNWANRRDDDGHHGQKYLAEGNNYLPIVVLGSIAGVQEAVALAHGPMVELASSHVKSVKSSHRNCAKSWQQRGGRQNSSVPSGFTESLTS